MINPVLQSIAANTELIRQQVAEILERMGRGQETPKGIDILRRALQTGQVTLAGGERSVAIGGNVSGSTIITGDHNQVKR